jgi:hypothetical protein
MAAPARDGGTDLKAIAAMKLGAAKGLAQVLRRRHPDLDLDVHIDGRKVG